MQTKNSLMKKFIYIITISFLAISCQLNDKKKAETKSVNQHKSKTIEYELGEGISTEGAGATADYEDGKIKKCTTNIYGEMGQIEIIYTFKGNQINVTQENLTYSTEGDSINRQKWTSEKIVYVLDRNGLLISSKADQEKISDIFEEVQKSVPFELK